MWCCFIRFTLRERADNKKKKTESEMVSADNF